MRLPDVHHVLICWSSADFLAAGEPEDERLPLLVEIHRTGVTEMGERLFRDVGGAVTIASGTPGRPVARARRIAEQVFRSRAGARICLWFAPDPLYRSEDIRRALDVLEGEEDAIAYAGCLGHPGEIAFAAVRTLHTGLFAAAGGVLLPSLGGLVSCDASAVPLRPAVPCLSSAGFPALLHELERERLLDRWYPQNMYRLVRRRLPPEEAE